MKQSVTETPRVYHSKVDGSGRIVLPSDLRMRQHIQAGDQVVITETDKGLELTSYDQAVHAARALFARLAPADVLLSEELIRDRRTEEELE